MKNPINSSNKKVINTSFCSHDISRYLKVIGFLVLIVMMIKIWFGANVRMSDSTRPPTPQNELQFPTTMSSLAFPQLYRCINRSKSNDSSLFFGQSLEDSWLFDNIFSKLPLEELVGGTFVEIGAHDGISNSNTLYFEKAWDWRGLLIEGHPLNSQELHRNRNIRSNSVLFSTAICRENADGTFGELTFTKSGNFVGTTKEFASKSFLRKRHTNDTDLTAGSRVTCTPMQKLLNLTSMLDIDLFSLDVEGAELIVLQTINWNITNIRVLLVELDGSNIRKETAIRALLTDVGFISSTQMGLGSIKTICIAKAVCMPNEVFINPVYRARAREREKVLLMHPELSPYREEHTGMHCSVPLIPRFH
jgi:FkbM family methyltransferase